MTEIEELKQLMFRMLDTQSKHEEMLDEAKEERAEAKEERAEMTLRMQENHEEAMNAIGHYVNKSTTKTDNLEVRVTRIEEAMSA